MSKQSDLQGESWLTLQTQPLSLKLPRLMEMSDGCFFSRALLDSFRPQSSLVFWYFKAKSSTLNVPIHPLYLQIFQNFKTLLKFFFFMKFLFRPASREGNIILYCISFPFRTIHWSGLSRHLIGAV